MSYVQIIPHRTRPFSDLDAPGAPVRPWGPWTTAHTFIVLAVAAAAVATIGAFLPPEPKAKGPADLTQEQARVLQEGERAIRDLRARTARIQADMKAIRKDVAR